MSGVNARMGVSVKSIPLSQDQFAFVDDEDYLDLVYYTWSAAFSPHTKTYYAVRSVRQPDGSTVQYKMHRQILGFPEQEVDHRNGETLDNRRFNLREATREQNMHNRGPHVRSKSGVKGVIAYRNGYRSSIKSDGVQLFLGDYPTLELAAGAYQLAALCLHGEFAHGS